MGGANQFEFTKKNTLQSYHSIHPVGSNKRQGVDRHLRPEDVEEPSQLTQGVLPPTISVLDVSTPANTMSHKVSRNK